MKKPFLLGMTLCAVAVFASAAEPQGQAGQTVASGPPAQLITRAGEQKPIYGSADYFTGRARVDPLFSANEDVNAYGAYVTFDPGSRTAWHTHPAGQRLVVTSGIGLTQEWGKPVQVIREGDVVWCPPEVKHWHGATANSAMTHLAVGRSVDGKSVTWMEKVTDEQYNAR